MSQETTTTMMRDTSVPYFGCHYKNTRLSFVQLLPPKSYSQVLSSAPYLPLAFEALLFSPSPILLLVALHLMTLVVSS